MTVCDQCGRFAEGNERNWCGCSEYGYNEKKLVEKISNLFKILEHLGTKIENLEKTREN
jgi:hypothetical protein